MKLTDDLEWQRQSNQIEMAVSLGADLLDVPEAELDDEGLINCPLIPLRDMVMYPHMITPLFVGRERSVQAADAAVAGDHTVVVVAQRDLEVYDPHPEDLHTVGTEVVIARSLHMPEGTLSVLAQGRRRVEIVEYVHWEPYARVRARPRRSTGDKGPSRRSAAISFPYNHVRKGPDH